MNKKIIYGILNIVTIVLAIYAYFVLPDTVVVQVDFAGNASNTSPKLLAIIVPMAIAQGAAYIYLAREDKESKSLTISIVGILVLLFTIIFNILFKQ